MNQQQQAQQQPQQQPPAAPTFGGRALENIFTTVFSMSASHSLHLAFQEYGGIDIDDLITMPSADIVTEIEECSRIVITFGSWIFSDPRLVSRLTDQPAHTD